MSYTLDPQLVPILAAQAEQAAGLPARERGDWRAMREAGNLGQAAMAAMVPPVTGIKTTTYFATARDGTRIELRWYTTGEKPAPGPAVLYAHGGGMVLGDLDAYDTLLSWYVAQSGVPFLSVGYRLAPEATGTMLAEDVFAGLTWLVEHAHEVGVDATRIAVMGDSGGGAPAAATAILARDRQVPLARQILVYPMLDDRNQTPDPAREPFLTWTYDSNYTAWNAVLGDALGTATVSPIAAPARLHDFTGLAPAYIDTGDLDIFRDEDISYAARLAAAGVPVELHVHLGVPHGWDRIAPQSQAARRAFADRIRTLAAL
ncbi:alpha/beta hydrolase [Streptomyces violaceusniger]|uniref:Alpha/beta hydrolase domain-containing protein n=1 Tax=Streptomyces violaceusniger (strain Tu 4113) TaxID=653045 RepID=G2P835_STRV4|nr:alpha/beta hydrolase [Streptomyces violaceusniger]AEM85836.1 alpha/beta hydrolase domain-containing protein [Streptomyces violaceusniger Tu 4113]